jgi:hypothetical protein
MLAPSEQEVIDGVRTKYNAVLAKAENGKRTIKPIA